MLKLGAEVRRWTSALCCTMLDHLVNRWRRWRGTDQGSIPDTRRPLCSWRTALLVFAPLFVCAYALSVLVYVQGVPDFGLRCAFTTVINRVHTNHLRPEPGQLIPAPGDRIVQVGKYPIHTWPDLLRANEKLGSESVESEQPQAERSSQATHIQRDGEELVLVKFQKQGPDDQPVGPEDSIWCLLDRLHMESLVPSLLWFLLKGGLFLVALLVFWKRPDDLSARQFFLFSIVTVGAYMGGYHWWRIATQPVLMLVFMICAVMLPAFTLHFFLIFPRPKQSLERRPIPVLLAVYGLPLLFLAAMIYCYFHVRALARGHATPDAVNAALNFFLFWVIYVYLAVAGAIYLACVVCLGHSFWSTGDSTERNQVKWILFGSLAALAPIGYSLYLAFWEKENFGSGAATWPMFAASVCFTAAFAISITRYRLMQLDQVLTSGMVYFLISFLAGLGYYAVVFIGMLLVGSQVISGPSLAQALTVSTTALVLTLVLDLARSRFKKALDRRFRRQKYHLDQTLERMGQTLEQMVDPPTLARRFLHTAVDLLGVSRGAIYLREGDAPLYRLADSLGETPPLTELALGCPLVDTLQSRSILTAWPDAWGLSDPGQGQLRFLGGEVAQALTHEGRLLAMLLLGPKETGGYTREDLHLLASFAQITSLALQNAERHCTIEALNRDVQAKVEKISEQQRRILALQSQLTRQESGTRSPESGSKEHGSGVRSLERGEGIIGSSPVVRQLLQLVKKAAASPSTVLLRGESGTGKQLLARALHDHSPRTAKAFVTVQCNALSPGLLESELFGHVKGAYTGAHRDKVGRFELANGGTLFLDEIGDINLEVQTKLLRVLQEKTFERVGSSEPVQVDVRVLAATNQDLEELIRKERFRQDLYYRLNVISIQVPPLRERAEDIPELAMHFLRVYAQRSGRAVTQIDDDALAVLKGYGWPGNIRQLENAIDRAVVFCEGPLVTVDDLPPDLLGDTNGEAPPVLQTISRSTARREQAEQKEREQLVRALATAAGNKAEAARALGMARSTLLSRLKKYGLS